VLIGLVLPTAAVAQGTGFEGDFWYVIVNGNYTVPSPGQWYSASEHHSYGFNSVKNISINNNGYVGGEIRNLSNNNALAASGSAYNFVRMCVHGTYPNCTDTDGWTGAAWEGNNSNVNLRMQSHGVY